MQPIELTITSSVKDRVEVAAILVKNGYRVWTESRKGSGSARVTLLCADKPGKELGA